MGTHTSDSSDRYKIALEVLQERDEQGWPLLHERTGSQIAKLLELKLRASEDTFKDQDGAELPSELRSFLDRHNQG